MTGARSALAAMLVALLVALAHAGASSLGEMPRARVDVDGREFPVRLAVSTAHRAAGFQHVAPADMSDAAIYFVYDPPVRPGFHMRNVARPLRLAWIRPDGRVLDVIRMQPGSSGHRPAAPVAGVLEFTADHPLAERVRPGSTIVLLPPP